MEHVSDEWADSRPRTGGEFLDVCCYCDRPVYSNVPFGKRLTEQRSSYYVHLDCEDNFK